MKTEIRLAAKKDIPALCEMWGICFSDPEDYIKLFYSENFDRMKVFVYTLDGRPVCMANAFDSLFCDSGKTQKAMFLYAGCTLPEYRHNGYFKKLISFLKCLSDRTGAAIFFKPASPALADFYRTLGLEVGSYFRLVTVNPVGKQPLSVSDISFTEYNRMRDAAFGGIPYVRWDDEHIRWCVSENKYFNGRTLKTNYGSENHFLMAYPSDDTLIINETDMSLGELKEFSGALCDIFGTKLIKSYMPDSCGEGERIISSVIYNTDFRNIYINQILL